MKRLPLVVAALLYCAEVSSANVPELEKGSEQEQLASCRDKAEHGSPEAMFAWAYYNEHGIGMPVDKKKAIDWYWKICRRRVLLPREIEEESIKAIGRLRGFDTPFDPATADGDTIQRFIARTPELEEAKAWARVFRNKTVGRTLTFTNQAVFYVQRLKDGGIILALDPKDDDNPPRYKWTGNSCASIRVLADDAFAQKARYLDRWDVVDRLECLVVTNCHWYDGFVVKGLSMEPKDPTLDQPLPDFGAESITGDELLDYLKSQKRAIRKWQFIEMQSPLVGRRLTFRNLRLSGSESGSPKMDSRYWIGAVPKWERVGEGDLPGSAEFKLSFGDETMRRFARQLVRCSSFALLDEVSGTFVKVENPDDGWAFQLTDVSLVPKGAVRGLDTLGDGEISGDDLIRLVGANFTPIARLSLAFNLAGRDVSFVSGVVESCQPCWTNDTFSLVCRMTPWISDIERARPLRVAFQIPPERSSKLRRTPIPGDLVVNLKGCISEGEDDLPCPRNSEIQVLHLDNADFGITWRSDIAKTSGLDNRPGPRIVRRLSMCWPEVKQDQFIRLARQMDGQTVEFTRGRFQHSYDDGQSSHVCTVDLEDPLYGRCVAIELLVPEGDLAMRLQELKPDTILRNIRGVLTAEVLDSRRSHETMRVRLKDAAFDIDEK